MTFRRDPSTREEAYLEILHWGLIRLRNEACGENQELCAIEADHLHNLPALIAHPSEEGHAYYLDTERPVYLERLEKLGAEEYLQRAHAWYDSSWEALESSLGKSRDQI